MKIKEAEERDRKILAEEDLAKPVQPADLDSDTILKDLRADYERVRKVPGESLLFFEIVEEPGSISNNNQCSS